MGRLRLSATQVLNGGALTLVWPVPTLWTEAGEEVGAIGQLEPCPGAPNLATSPGDAASGQSCQEGHMHSRQWLDIPRPPAWATLDNRALFGAG